MLQQTLAQYQDQLKPIKEKQEELLQQINELEKEVKTKMIRKSTYRSLLCFLLNDLKIAHDVLIFYLNKNDFLNNNYCYECQLKNIK